ncbi:hypothetical protein D3C71_1750540 [compost metagenome]
MEIAPLRTGFIPSSNKGSILTISIWGIIAIVWIRNKTMNIGMKSSLALPITSIPSRIAIIIISINKIRVAGIGVPGNISEVTKSPISRILPTETIRK